MYNFDEVIDRKNTNCAKWDGGFNNDEKMLKMWVADMDFKVLPEISIELAKRALDGVYGYGIIPDSYYESVISWMKRRHDFIVEKDWFVLTSGVVASFNLAIQAYSKENESIMILSPVYYPFKNAVLNNKRHLVSQSLDLIDDHYELDFDLFEKNIKDNDVKMLIFCNPHNPVGKVWNEDELRKIGNICKKYNVIVFSDEIHMDFIFKGYKHIPFYNVDESFKDIAIVATAASKTFNLAGLQTSNIFIANKELKDKFNEVLKATGYFAPNIFGVLATEIAYSKGDLWVDEMNSYVQDNFKFMEDYFKKNMDFIKLIKPEGLYLAWVDFRSLNLSHKKQEQLMLKDAHLWLDEGVMFGDEGIGFERFNLALPRSVLEKALHQLKDALIKNGYIK